jgi:hypothetical protein
MIPSLMTHCSECWKKIERNTCVYCKRDYCCAHTLSHMCNASMNMFERSHYNSMREHGKIREIKKVSLEKS